jgi:CheY-like chemotaxis protein
MSAGVSHNLNNILTGVLGPAELIGLMTDQKDVLHEADLIRTSAMRARDLVMRLHDSVRGEPKKVGSVNLDRVVEAAIETGKPRWKDEPESLGRQICLTRDLKAEAMVGATEQGLRDLILNLLFNAADALTSGGTIHVTTAKSEDRVVLTVSDDGIGVDEEVRRRVFEPFFTTKADVGTGLGLSTVYGQVTRWGGNIEVKSEPGRGTTFEIDLPVWNGDVPPSTELQTVSRRGRILVVEDEEMVRDVVGSVLGLKHEVQAEEDGEAALRALGDGSFDIVLIDLGMPNMPGDQVALMIREIDPRIVTVLMTGWSLADDDPRLMAFDLSIQKPFADMAALLQVVDRAIQMRDQRSGEDDTP